MRQPKPWFRTSKNAWFVELGGKQVRLAKGRDSEKQAFEAFYRLMSARPENLLQNIRVLGGVLVGPRQILRRRIVRLNPGLLGIDAVLLEGVYQSA